mgnify:CR=1
MDTSAAIELHHPWYQTAKGQVSLGSSVLFENGSQVVLHNRLDFSRHGGTPPHVNTSVQAGPSGGVLEDVTQVAKAGDFHYIVL